MHWIFTITTILFYSYCLVTLGGKYDQIVNCPPKVDERLSWHFWAYVGLVWTSAYFWLRAGHPTIGFGLLVVLTMLPMAIGRLIVWKARL